VLFLATKAHHVFNTGAVIPAAVEDDDFTSGGELFKVTLNMELRLLSFGWRGEGSHAKNSRADALHNALNDATLAGSVPSFKKNDNSGVARLDSVLNFDQLKL